MKSNYSLCSVKVLGRRALSKTLRTLKEIKSLPYGAPYTIPIVAYHQIVSQEEKLGRLRNYKWAITEETFDRQMRYLHEEEYYTISCDELYQWYHGQIKLPKKSVMITVDDGYENVSTHMAPILQKYDFKATAFIIGSHIEKGRKDPFYMTLEQVTAVKKDFPCLDFQSHSYDLHYKKADVPVADTLLYDALFADCFKARELGYTSLAYPYGESNKAYVAAAKDNGFIMGFLYLGWQAHRYARRSLPLFRMPRMGIDDETSFEEFVAKVTGTRNRCGTDPGKEK